MNSQKTKEHDIRHTVDNGNAIAYVNGVAGTLNKADIDTLVAATVGLEEGSVYVETGTYLGCSALAVALHNPKLLVYCHDIWVTDWEDLSADGKPPPTVQDYFYKFYNSVIENNLRQSMIPVRGDSKYTLGIHTEKSIDVAFIDGDHSYLGCLADLNTILPKMKPHSTILSHDCNEGSGCLEAVKVFCQNNQLIFRIIPNSCGMAEIKI
jgi:Methyltransferase domain